MMSYKAVWVYVGFSVYSYANSSYVPAYWNKSRKVYIYVFVLGEPTKHVN